ncbi:amidase signature domain-containing protein [Aspergillus foveolatus]|uniref:amidase signature domain-containing protein n=1 Tax=Aspergillus foveolatus TaxID=210207 RepID=UPI003CCDC2CE
MTQYWEELAADKRARLAKTIPAGILSEAELKITEPSAADLASKLAAGQLTSVEVTLAFFTTPPYGTVKLTLASVQTNCALECFPDAALAQARELDEYYAKHKRPVGPLHGLPVSLKDQLRVKYDEGDSIMTTMLRKAGAVFYVKASVPQTLMVCETVNDIIGRTVNPRNKNWSDGYRWLDSNAGRVQLPVRSETESWAAAVCKDGEQHGGSETVHSVVAPITHSVEGPPLSSFLAFHIIYEAQYRLLHFDGNVLPHPPILRGVETTIAALAKTGHAVTPRTPYKHDFGHGLISHIYAADGSAVVMRDISASGEPAIPNIKDLLNPNIKAVNMNELWDTHLQKWNYQMEYLEKWREAEEKAGKELDAIIAPITPTAAVRHDQFRYYGYASVINLLDFTSVIVPVTFANKNIDKKNESFKAVSELDALVQEEYDPEAYHGAPVAVQVIGRRLSEERTLAIAEEVGRLLGNVVTP